MPMRMEGFFTTQALVMLLETEQVQAYPAQHDNADLRQDQDDQRLKIDGGAVQHPTDWIQDGGG